MCLSKVQTCLKHDQIAQVNAMLPKNHSLLDKMPMETWSL